MSQDNKIDSQSEVQLKTVVIRKIPTQRRSQKKVNEILNATEILIEQEGIDRITTIKIAEKAKISIGTLYGYFPNKESVLYSLAERWLNMLRDITIKNRPSQQNFASWIHWNNNLLEELRTVYEQESGIAEYYGMLRSIPELREMDENHDQWIIDETCEVFEYFGYVHDKEQLKTDVTTILILIHSMLVKISAKSSLNSDDLFHNLKIMLRSLLITKFDK